MTVPPAAYYLIDHWFAGALLVAGLVLLALHALLARSENQVFATAHVLTFLAALAFLGLGESALLAWGAFGLFNVSHNFLVLMALALWVGAAFTGATVVLIPQLSDNRIVSLPLFVALGLVLAGAGGLVLTPSLAFLLAMGAAGVLTVMLCLVFLSGYWWAPLGYVFGAILMLGMGGWVGDPAGHALQRFAGHVLTWWVAQRWWLLLLALLPVVLVVSYFTLTSLPPLRRWTFMGLVHLLVLLQVLALADVRADQPGDTTVIIFVVDASLSIPETGTVFVPLEGGIKLPVETHEVIDHYINTMVETREKRDYSRYQFGVIYFGAQPRLVRSPTDAPRINVKHRDIVDGIDRNYTNIQEAINLAMASFPEGVSKRIVLLTDGNENLGNVESQALLAKGNDVQIDVVPLGKGQHKTNEVLIQSIEAPSEVEEGAPTLVQVSVRNFHPSPKGVIGDLTVKQKLDSGDLVNLPTSPRTVKLKPGINTFTFEQPKQTNKQHTYTYVAEFIPRKSFDEDGNEVVGLPGDLKENNTATTHVVVSRSKNRVLLLEETEGAFELLEENLPTDLRKRRHPEWQETPKYEFVRRLVSSLPKAAELGAFLSGFDCVILANIPANSIDKEQQEIIKSNTHDQGSGLIMVGGPVSFGAGGWQGTPVEEALPVDTNIRSFKIQGKVGLVMLMHASEMAQGNFWQKEIAKTAIKELSDTDEVGILEWSGLTGGHQWFLDLQPVDKLGKEALIAKVDNLTPGDMPDFGGGLRMAYKALSDPKKDFVGKHVIVISDGDPQQTDGTVLADMKANKITVTTVGVATHGVAEDTRMKDIAERTGGRYYKVTNPAQLPAIYLKETRLITQDFLFERPFTPELNLRAGPAENLKNPLPKLKGFVRTQAKPAVSVAVPIKTPLIAGHDFPILAYWHYGLGKSVAFTSDADTIDVENKGRSLRWSAPWFDEQIYGSFWEGVIGWAVRPVESHLMTMTTEIRDGKARVVVSVRDKNGRPVNNLIIKGGITSPGKLHPDRLGEDLKFEQKKAGTYEAEFKAEEAGSYFVNASAIKMDGKDGEVFDSVRAGISVPYSPEFAEVESNSELVEKIAMLTDGKVLDEADLQELYLNGVLAGKVALPDTNEAKKLPAVASKDRAEAQRKHAEEAHTLLADVVRRGPPPARAHLPLWFWLVFLAGIVLLFDVAVRRVAIEPDTVWRSMQAYWERLRGRAVPLAATGQFLDRLRSRKVQAEETMVKGGRRFEAGDQPVAAAPSAADAAAPPSAPPRPAPPRQVPEEQGEPGDFASRLMRAKKRAQEERQKPPE
jgi:uncharacterized membrane protein